MGKKREIDPGLQYLREIGFERIRGLYGLADRLRTVFGNAKAEEIWKMRESLPLGSKELYDFLNSDPKISRIFFEAFDGDIIRKAINYVHAHREYFGNRILEVGCNSGYMTCYLAKAFPDAEIVSIDRSEAAVNMAKHNADAMGIHNVEFRTCYLQDVSEQFDTVFCMRTIQENFSHEDAPFFGEPIIAQFYEYGMLTKEYTDTLISCLKPDGRLIVFERIGQDPLMCGWMMRLCTSACSPDVNTYTGFVCEEGNLQNKFQAFICQNGLSEEPQKMVDLWCTALQIDYTGRTRLKGWNALIYLNDNAGELIRDVRIISADDEEVGRFAIFHDKDDESHLYYLSAPGGGEIELFGFNPSELDNCLENMQKTIDKNITVGHHAIDANPEEDFIEGIAFRE